MTFPMKPSGLVPISVSLVNSSREMASWPNGKNEKLPITKQARPQGIPIILMKASNPKNHHAKPIKIPPNKNQIMLPNVLMTSPYSKNTAITKRLSYKQASAK